MSHHLGRYHDLFNSYLVIFAIQKRTKRWNNSSLNNIRNLKFRFQHFFLIHKNTWCLLPETVRLEMAQAASFLVEKSDWDKWSIIGGIKPASITAWKWILISIFF